MLGVILRVGGESTLDTILPGSGKGFVHQACEATEQASAKGSTPFAQTFANTCNTALLSLLALLAGKLLIEGHPSQPRTNGSQHSACAAEDTKAPDEAESNANKLTLRANFAHDSVQSLMIPGKIYVHSH